MTHSPPITLKQKFFEPIKNAFKNAKLTRVCTGYSDQSHIDSGIRRVIENVSSGREWVQRLQEKLSISVSVRNFFASLSSHRRMDLVKEINEDVCKQTDELLLRQNDSFSEHTQLNGFALYASDGHTHAASAHEQPVEGKKHSVTHLYSINLRTQSMSHLELAIPREGKKKEHEITTLKRMGGPAMRMNQPKGTKVISW